MANMEELKRTFFDECSELLQEIEAGLTDLRGGTGSDDTVHAVFRGVHSVKGGAGIFGYDSLVGFAHVLETVRGQRLHERVEFVRIAHCAAVDEALAEQHVECLARNAARLQLAGVQQRRQHGRHVVEDPLAPLLLALLYPRIRHARLLYRDVLGPRPTLPWWRTVLGVGLAVAGTTSAFAAGELIASGRWLAPWAPYQTQTGAFEVGLGLAPLIGLAIAGLALL